MPRRRLGVSARLLGAIIVPVLLLSFSLAASVGRSHREAQRAGLVSERTAVLRQLVELRSAVFRERLASEIFVPDRRPPAELLESTAFGSQIANDPDELVEHTDAALAAVDPADRPFTSDTLDRARAALAGPVLEDARGSAFDEVDAMLARKMAADLTLVRESAVELADVRLIRAGTALDRSIRLPEEAAYLVAELAELWTAPPADRPSIQSRTAKALATFESSVRRLGDDEVDRPAIRSDVLADRVKLPERLGEAVDAALDGTLTEPERPLSQPVEVGLALLAGVDWLLEVDEIPMGAADDAMRASASVSSDARSVERRSAFLAAFAVLGSVAAAVLFGRSIVRPVRRLTDQAERIGSGQLDPVPPATGPPEIVRASDAMNDVVENLVLLERKSQALARADFADSSLQQPLPGRLGSSLQLSMAVLSESIEERESLQSRLEFEASHDSLTGIGNRASLIDELRRMGEEATGSDGTVAVTFLDLDDFKGINDRHGHSLGDEVLRVIARRMVAVAPDGALVARLGGDEFVIAMAGIDGIDEPIEIARRVVEAVSAPMELGGRTMMVTASAGVAVVGVDGDRAAIDPSALLHMADLAVYTAKLDPEENVAVYDDDLDRRLIRQREVEAALRSALGAESRELHLVFQPIMDADGARVRRLEALLRWNRPEVGPVAPDVFIPVAESSDLILDLDRWVIDAALHQLSAWSTDPSLSAIPVAVNVSGRSLLDRSFVDRVAAALSRSGVSPAMLSIEVTETVLVSDLEMAAQQLGRVREIGVSVAIDDFGTGYTSVAHLRALPIDELKIDGGFIRDLTDEGDRGLIEMITQLGHQLRLPVVAEGVETIDQVEVLRAIGCDRLQGYFFSLPLRADDLREWVEGRGAPRRSEGCR